MFHRQNLKLLDLLEDASMLKKPVTLSQLHKRELGVDLSNKLQKNEFTTDESEVRIAVADGFAAIKKKILDPAELIDTDKTATAIENYLKYFPRSIEAYVALGSVYEHEGNCERALDVIHGALYLDPVSPKMNRRQQRMEDQILARQKPSIKMKVKCYSTTRLFEEWNTANSKEELMAKVRSELQRQISDDLCLLSPLSIGVSLSSVPQFYNELDSKYEDKTHLQKAYFLQQSFPFLCVAADPLPSGTLVMADIPFAIAPLIDADNPRVFPTCFHCLKERHVQDRGFACPLFPQSCPFIFCSVDCVLRNVNVHRQECGFITSIVFPLAKETGFSVGFVLLILRALCRSYIEHSLRKPESEELQFFFRLHSFISDYKSKRSWIWNCISALSRGLCMMLPLEFRCHMGERELSEFIAIVHSNLIPISYKPPAVCIQRGAPTASLGLALCYNVCSLGHSCLPNCAYAYTPDGRVAVRTLVDVPKNEQLTASFVEDLYLPTAMRKNIETSWKIIMCNCNRCADNHEGFRYVAGQRCGNCINGIRCPQQNLILNGILEEQTKQRVKPELNEGNDENDLESLRRKEAESSAWHCSSCGKLSMLDSNRCDVIEVKIRQAVDEARAAWEIGEGLKARKLFEETFHQYKNHLHRNHYILYTLNVFLAGLWSHGAGRNFTKALFHLKKAIIAARSVLPFYHIEFVHLFQSYADIVFSLSIASKRHRRGDWIKEDILKDMTNNKNEANMNCTEEDSQNESLQGNNRLRNLVPLSPIEAQWVAVVNAWMVCGPRSSLWIAALQRLRHLITAMEQRHTPPLLYVPKIINAERARDAMCRLLRNQGLTTEEIRNMITRDHLCLTAAACASGDVMILKEITKDDASTKRENETPDLMTGLTALGQAAVAKKIEAVRHLLQISNADLFSKNEWQITPLLAMASYPLAQMSDETSRNKEDYECSLICGLFIEKAKQMEKDRIQQISSLKISVRQDIDITKFPFLRHRLLYATSHPVIGANTAAHYAAVRNKSLLLSQLIRGGLNVNCRNIEHATPLHLGSLQGHVPVVEELIKNHQADVDAANFRGETSLMLGCYALHQKVVSVLLNQGGANVQLESFHSSMNCLHALILGLTKTHRLRYMGSNKSRMDLLSTCLQGLNPISIDFINYDWVQPPVVYLAMPVSEPEGSSLFLFPETLLKRLSLAEEIARSLLQVCPASMYTHTAKVGYTASELLKHRACYILEQHQEAWSRSDLRLAALSPKERIKLRQKWRETFNRIDVIMQLITPDKLPIPVGSTGAPKDETSETQLEKTSPYSTGKVLPSSPETTKIKGVVKETKILPTKAGQKATPSAQLPKIKPKPAPLKKPSAK